MLYNWDDMKLYYGKLLEINPEHKREAILKKSKDEGEQEKLFQKLERQQKGMKQNKFDFY